MRSANRSRGKPPPTRSGAACSGKNSKSPPSSPDAINRPLTRIRHGDSRHRNRNAQYLAGPSSKDFQALRRTVGTSMESIGIPMSTISGVLNHAEGGVTKIYNRYSYSPEKRLALEAWAQKLCGIVRVRAGDNV